MSTRPVSVYTQTGKSELWKLYLSEGGELTVEINRPDDCAAYV